MVTVPRKPLVLMTPSLVYKPTAWADIGGGSQTSRRQHGGMEVGSSPAYPRHPLHVRCPEGLGRTLGVSARRLTWLRHLHTALSPCDVRCSVHATRKPTVIVGYSRDEEGIRCRAPGCSNPGIAQMLYNGRGLRAEG
jgi:hypothetical protein